MKLLIRLCLHFVIVFNFLFANAQLPTLPDSLFSSYYHQRVSLFKLMPKSDSDILFVGNSISDGAEWTELFNDANIKNRGISGDITIGLLNRLPDLVQGKPTTIFFMIGINDLARGVSVDSIVNNILMGVDFVQHNSPTTKIFVQSILPVTDYYKKFSDHTSKSESIRQVNEMLQSAASRYAYTYIDLYTPFLDDDGKLNKRFTNDGLHLLGEGYLLWKHLVYPYVYGSTLKPALLPEPQQVIWRNTHFPVHKARGIFISDKRLEKEAQLVVDLFSNFGKNLQVDQDTNDESFIIQLKLSDNLQNNHYDHAYHLNVSANKIEVVSNTPNGIFNAIQTLRQLLRDGVMIPTCEIKDWPAFSWRGFMVDVGRNYLPMKMLKEQIDLMSRYKMNVFHFHPTEDIAWRIQIKQYPQLTSPEYMLRNKGKYYSVAEIKDLIQYCKDRYIKFIPEIDMPGHSAAFKRAMGTDMQSEEGKIIVSNILNEIIETYELEYIHIGSDEVNITDRSFVPDMTSLIERKGLQVIGWQPGGNFNSSTIRQLWRGDDNSAYIDSGIKFIDSKHLYLNHMDPLESVVTIYNRKIANRDAGDSFSLGAILCLWHDRALSQFDDLMQMNPVYPGMLAFAERTWRGGGQSGWVANVSDGDGKRFSEFEKRLMSHRQQSFKGLPFPYVEQSNLKWDLFGPYENKGNLSWSFPIERQLNSNNSLSPQIQVTGGTIVLRHWWSPFVKGAIEDPKENTTWYASTRIWSPENRIGKFWIGFNNFSRSPATDSPPLNSWNYNQGKVWVNGLIIDPPNWQRPGQKGDLEIPLIDEGYEYRPPTSIPLKEGWNTILIKIPVGSFKGSGYHNPVKWMFSFIEVN